MSLKFNQKIVTAEKITDLLPDDVLGTKYEEGFTSLSVKEGLVFLNDRPLNEREKKRGTEVPKISVQQVTIVSGLAKIFAENEELKSKKIFVLCSNNDSRWIKNGPENIRILGYYKENQFVFAAQDPILRHYPDVNPMLPARELFSRDGAVIIPNPEEDNPSLC